MQHLWCRKYCVVWCCFLPDLRLSCWSSQWTLSANETARLWRNTWASSDMRGTTLWCSLPGLMSWDAREDSGEEWIQVSCPETKDEVRKLLEILKEMSNSWTAANCSVFINGGWIRTENWTKLISNQLFAFWKPKNHETSLRVAWILKWFRTNSVRGCT